MNRTLRIIERAQTDVDEIFNWLVKRSLRGAIAWYLTGAVHEILTRITGHELRGEGRVYGGGLQKIEQRELGRISAGEMVGRWADLGENVMRVGVRYLF